MQLAIFCYLPTAMAVAPHTISVFLSHFLKFKEMFPPPPQYTHFYILVNQLKFLLEKYVCKKCEFLALYVAQDQAHIQYLLELLAF